MSDLSPWMHSIPFSEYNKSMTLGERLKFHEEQFGKMMEKYNHLEKKYLELEEKVNKLSNKESV